MKAFACAPASFMVLLSCLTGQVVGVRFGKGGSATSLSSYVVDYVHTSGLAKLGSSARDIADTFEGYFSESYGTYLQNALIFWAIFVGLSALTAACFYTKNVVPKARLFDYSSKTEFQHGHFNCFSESETCLCTLLCPAVRWADSVSMFGYMTFWPAFLTFALLTLANTLIRCPLLVGPFTAVGMFLLHQGMRKKVGAPYCTCGNALPDCCLALFFPHCSISQEARAARMASQERLVGPPAKVLEGPPLSSATLTVQTVPPPAPDRLVITEDKPEGVYVAPPVIVSRGP